MVMAFVNKYRYVIYFVFALVIYLSAIELINANNERSTRPTYGEQVVYACPSGKITVMSVMNGKFKQLLLVNTHTGEGLSPKDFYEANGKCIMFERRQPFTISSEGITPYLPIINKAKEEGQYE